MTELDPALVQQILNVPQGQRVADIQNHRQADDRRARLELAEGERRVMRHAKRPGRLVLGICSYSACGAPQSDGTFPQ